MMTSDHSTGDSPLGRLLVHPWETITQVVTGLVQNSVLVAVLAVLLVVAAAGASARSMQWLRLRAVWRRDARVITIKLPPEVDTAAAEAFWGNLVGLLGPRWKRLVQGQPHVIWEYFFDAEAVSLRLWIPAGTPAGMAARAIAAAWPGATTQTQPANEVDSVLTAPADQQPVAAGGQLRLARTEALPLRSDFDADPLRALWSAAAVAPGQRACVQVLARPVTSRPRTHGEHGLATAVARAILDLLTPGTTRPQASSARRGPAGQDRVTMLEAHGRDRAMLTKRHGPTWAIAVRYAVTATVTSPASRAERAAARDRLRGKAHGLASAFAGFSGHNYLRRRRLWRPITTLGRGWLRGGDRVSVPELAALAHLPLDEAAPGLTRAGAKVVAPPARIPRTGIDVRPVGTCDTGASRPVGLTAADGRHHLHVLGATGSGKSTLLARMILADAEAGRGAVVIDPKGDLVTDILTRLPDTGLERLVLFDPLASANPCLNPLEGPKHATVDNLVSVFSRVFASSWGPRTEDILRAACLTLRARDDAPTLDVLPRLLTDPATRARHRHAVAGDPTLRGFWDWYDQLTDAGQAAVTAPLLNKLRAFLLRPFVTDTLAAGHSTVDLDEVLDGGLCLIRIPKGSLGEDTCRLVGSLILARIWQATLRRAGQPEKTRRDACLYVDEAHNFLNLPYAIEDMLAEARGYRLSMTLAHQHLGQLPTDLKEGTSANARSKIFFTAGPEDARALARHTAPRLSEHDLAHLDAFHAAARLVVDGQHTAPFTITTQPLGPRRTRPREARDAAVYRLQQQTAQRATSADPRLGH